MICKIYQNYKNSIVNIYFISDIKKMNLINCIPKYTSIILNILFTDIYIYIYILFTDDQYILITI